MFWRRLRNWKGPARRSSISKWGSPISILRNVSKRPPYRAICEGKTHYTHSLGLIELREAICEDYWKRYRVKVSPDQILIASGTSPAMLLLFSALLESGR